MTDDRESDLQTACIGAARSIGCEAFANVVVRKGKRATGLGKGSPDVLCVIPGVRAEYIWFELKTPTGRRSPAQIEWHAKAARLGMRVYTIQSVTEMVACITAVRFGRAA